MFAMQHLVAFLLLATYSAALPTGTSTAVTSPHLVPASNVGPARSLDRLRSRLARRAIVGNPKAKRTLNDKIFSGIWGDKRSLTAAPVVANPKAKRTFNPASLPNPKAKRSTSTVTNPKSKRSLVDRAPVPAASPIAVPEEILALFNPKSKRSTPPASLPNPKAKRSVVAPAIANPKAKRAAPPSDSTIAQLVESLFSPSTTSNAKRSTVNPVDVPDLQRRAQVIAYRLAKRAGRASSPSTEPVEKRSMSTPPAITLLNRSNLVIKIAGTNSSSTAPTAEDFALRRELTARYRMEAKTNQAAAKRAYVLPTVSHSPTFTPAPSASTKAPRTFLSFLPTIFSRREQRRSIAFAAAPAPEKKRNVGVAKRDRRSSIAVKAVSTAAPRVGIVSIVPNPKSANYASVVASLSAAAGSAAASSSAASTAKWPTGDMIASAYYPDWDATILPPSQVDMTKFDLINYAFALPTSTYGLVWDDTSSGEILKELVSYAHGNNTKVIISVGGWSDSTYFSDAVKSANRAHFVQKFATMIATYKVDGVDIDWEYPGGGGDSGNEVDTENDTNNFLAFLQDLRAKIGDDKIISACTTQQAFIGSDGSPLTDVSAFADVLDYILVMNYDVWGASSTPGPNAPLSDACPNSNQPNANEQSAIETWTAAGMPASKILMGVPSYGYISDSTATTLVHKRSVEEEGELRMLNRRDRARKVKEMEEKKKREEKYVSPMRRWREEGKKNAVRRMRELQERDEREKRSTIIVCPNNHSGKPCEGITNQTIDTINWNPLNSTSSNNGNGTTTPGGVFTGPGVGVGKLGDGSLAAVDGNQIQFYQLISYGVLVQQGTSSNFTAVNGYTREWDECSNTPYLYDVSRSVVITYDDPQSMTLKAQMAAEYGLAGVGMWDISGDTADWQLVDAYRSGMGLST
ncbi:glycoside hydrolase family 18 protein [Pseudohyphozyma bogoriensis]|nr:glycoside hydrolase family 18 protein [Pseudohyphozyma bogoriensis]